ncbi:MAG: GrpB family protein, partial [Thermoplasmata archaeon]
VARTHHLHMVEFGGAFWTRNLLFRDWLRTHPEDARRYAALKYDLARRYRDDREAYTDAKTEFIEGIVEKARAAPLPTK